MIKSKEFPKLLYRPAIGKGNMVLGARVDVTIVDNISEQRKAMLSLWLPYPLFIVRLSKAIKIIAIVIRWLSSHWTKLMEKLKGSDHFNSD